MDKKKISRKRLSTGALAFVMVVTNALGLSGCHKNNDEHNHNQDLENPTISEENSRPAPSHDNPKLEGHTHNYGNWEAVDDFLEQRLCSCGDVEKQPHQYNTNNKYISNGDGTHLLVSVDTCLSCGHSLEKEQEENCRFTDWRYNEEKKQNERVCLDCGYVDILEHNHNWTDIIKTDDTYEYFACADCDAIKPVKHSLEKINLEDGSYLYKCQNPGCDYSYEEKVQHTHDFYLDKVDNENEYWVCSCGETQTIKHNITIISNEDGTIKYKCTNSDCNYEFIETPSHEHNYNNLIKIDDTYEYYQCSCGKMETRKHLLGEILIDDSSLDKYQRCQNPGCDYEVIVEKHKHNYDKLRTYDNLYEYWNCACGDEIKKNHNFKTEILADGSKKDVCTNPGCSYEVLIKPSHTHSYDTFVKYDDNYEYYQCSCGEISTKIHSLGVEEVDAKTHDTVRKCLNCDYQKVVKKHEHNLSFLNGDSDKETWQCIVCGEVIKKDHTYGPTEIDPNTYDEIQKCQTPNCNHILTVKKHEHSASVLLDGTGEQEVWGCPVCKENKTFKDHNLGNRRNNPDNKVNDILECLNPGCNYTKEVAHEHSYNLTSHDEDWEYYTCACGSTDRQTHNYNDGVIQDDGTYLLTCEKCGQTKSKHNHVEGTPKVEYFGADSEYCYQVSYYCNICHELVRSNPPVAHNWVEFPEDNEKMCSQCGQTKSLNSEMNIVLTYDDKEGREIPFMRLRKKGSSEK